MIADVASQMHLCWLLPLPLPLPLPRMPRPLSQMATVTTDHMDV
jgi:hypothetical protein